MAGFTTILLDKSEGVLEIALNRPRVVNAYNLQMRDELWQALHLVAEDPEVVVVLLRGQGEKGFCAGADLTEFGTAPSQAVARWVRFQRPIWEFWRSLDKPFVAALHGWVLGSGVEMALLCDLRLASEDAVFGMPETALGLIPAAGGTQTLPRFLRPSRALELLLTNRRLDAREALGWGLVHRLLPRGRLLGEARALARQLTRLDPHTLALAKRALRLGADLPLGEALHREERLALTALLGLPQGSGRGSGEVGGD